ncbi:DUF1846 domain-containing protein [Chitinispirillales bacterium ANBcel5]|uniref:DUF1846 domain-containing protein n=1 Tax=Cellulosispirillum alkaliphilum TaxID=3039283 RepID=UPI002A52EEF0|nr:DUF1846 domain-containing protein [Chitinispirillales bacterium ANBcel5]
MPHPVGFDNEKYLEQQLNAIKERVSLFQNKLYLEFGGKLLYDYHAARVLPGFDPNVKMRLLQKLKDNAEVILCIYAGDIERKKIRADFGITYDSDALKLIDDLSEWDINVAAIVITRYEKQAAAKAFKSKLERRGVKVFTHGFTKGYPGDVETIVSQEGYGSNAYIETTKPIVVVTGPGPGSGKLATCLSQLYHDHKRGIESGYAKFETFPVWNLSLKHEVNVAYESATADLKDVNLIDHFHLEAYGNVAVNYNRDTEAFPLLKRIIERITGKPSIYRSPTDMGVNRVAFGITDDSVVREAAKQEIIRRYFRSACEYAIGLVEIETQQRIELILSDLGAEIEQRSVVLPAREAAVEAKHKGKGNEGIYCGAAIELMDGTIITGSNSPLMHAASSLVLNATKHIAGIPEEMHLLPPNITESLARLKKYILEGKKVSLDLDETLIALGISAISNPAAEMALTKLKELRNCEVHMTHIPTPGDEAGLRKIGVNLTSDPNFSTKLLFIS